LHEQTHAQQFASAPWLAGHLSDRLRVLLAEEGSRPRWPGPARGDGTDGAARADGDAGEEGPSGGAGAAGRGGRPRSL
uniref:zinc-dependent metalloprotease n=1 Tax=Cellulomonas sp. GbtcB1 TaxID=2824746 RepID=UPI001C307110